MSNPDPTNEELEAWAARELLDLHQATVSSYAFGPRRCWITRGGDVVASVQDWHPTKEGSEHQAMMVEDKMFQLGWACALEGPIPGDANYLHTATFWWARTKDRDEEFTAVEPTRGHATVLAARRAAKGEK